MNQDVIQEADAVNQLTIRGFDKDFERHIVRVARGEGISLNRAVLKLLRRSAAIEDEANADDTIGTSPDHLTGTWTTDEFNEMEQSLGELSHSSETAMNCTHSWKTST